MRGVATSVEIVLSCSKNQEELVDKRPTIRSHNEESKARRAAPTSPPQPRWYRPDPVTGTWLPGAAGAEGSQVTTTTNTESVIPPKLITRIRAESTDSTEDKTWWTSMEELPDMDRHKDL